MVVWQPFSHSPEEAGKASKGNIEIVNKTRIIIGLLSIAPTSE
jgi:hypothetical protein